MTNTNTKTKFIRCDTETHKGLRVLAAKEGVTIIQMVRNLIESYTKKPTCSITSDKQQQEEK
jgi:predicted DNA-binding protein